MIEFNVDVDATGLHCPLPLLRLKKALKEMQSGEVVRVIATDPAAHLDFGVYAEQTANEIVEYFKDEEGRQIFFVRKK
jgi:tRNA 2-thiouridine synthesizing protein A